MRGAIYECDFADFAWRCQGVQPQAARNGRGARARCHTGKEEAGGRNECEQISYLQQFKFERNCTCLVGREQDLLLQLAVRNEGDDLGEVELHVSDEVIAHVVLVPHLDAQIILSL